VNPPTGVQQVIDRNLRSVTERIAEACRRAGRPPGSVALVAVTKYARPEWIPALVERGVVRLGENRPQQLVARAAALRLNVEWHLIGPLQRNKVRKVLPVASLIHSVDSLRLLEAIDRVAAELSLPARVLLEVNLSREPQKHGFDPQQLVNEFALLAGMRHVQIAGLMTMPARSDDPRAARGLFAQLRALRDQLRGLAPPGVSLPELSMGMTADFEVAIEEGATLVRIGSALWEGVPDA